MAVHFINASDLMGPDWRFLAQVCDDPGLTWETVSGQPRGVIERRIRRPNLGRYRAAFEAARGARRGVRPAVLVSHLPRMAAATNIARRIICPRVPHVAFAFNFTELPKGASRELLARALRGVDEFVVFSRFERALYADLFGIPESRIRFLPWAMDVPSPGSESPLPPEILAQGYICAIGGEGRDYALLAEVMRSRPALRLIIVARPHSISAIDFPPNVITFTNLPSAQTWRIAVDSRGLVIPLKTEATACGHITMVGAQFLGLPLIVTRSRGVEDYVVGEETAQTVPAGDDSALGIALDRIGAEPQAVARMAAAAQARAEAENSLVVWGDYFRRVAERFGGSPDHAPATDGRRM